MRGRLYWADARNVLNRVVRLKARARAMSEGLESSVLLGISVVISETLLDDVFADFASTFPETQLRIFIEEIGGVTQLLSSKQIDLGFAGKPSLELELFNALDAVPIGVVDVVAVTAHDHPLAKIDRALTDEDLQEYRQLLPTSRAVPAYPNQMVETIWEVADLDFSRASVATRAWMGHRT